MAQEVRVQEDGTLAPVTFLKDKKELDRLVKEFDKGARDALTVLAEIMHDVEAGKQTRMECATIIIESSLKAHQQRDADELARMVAEAKLLAPKIPSAPNGPQVPSTPKLDFTQVRQV